MRLAPIRAASACSRASTACRRNPAATRSRRPWASRAPARTSSPASRTDSRRTRGASRGAATTAAAGSAAAAASAAHIAEGRRREHMPAVLAPAPGRTHAAGRIAPARRELTRPTPAESSSPMKTRTLGRDGPELSALGLGCMGMSAFYGGRDEEESARTLHRAVELGVTFFDTADMYGQGDNEELVGRELRGVRDRVFIATKFANSWGPDRKPTGVRGDPAYVRQACEDSLRRLKVETIDLYYQHRVDPKTPIEETVGAMAELVQAGKVRFLGLSEAAPDTIRRAHATHPITALQTEYSLWSREPEAEIMPLLDELGIGFVPYSPLGRGFLSGAITSPDDLEPDDYRRNAPRFQGEAFAKNLELVAQVRRLAEAKGCTASQLALAWVLSRGEHVLPIPGTKKVRYLEENLAAADLVLTPDDLAALERAFPQGAATGDRYPEAGMKAVNR